MSPDAVDIQIARLDECMKNYMSLVETRVLKIEAEAESNVRAFRILSENRVGEIEVSLIPYCTYLYLSAEYHLACVLFYASPGWFAILMSLIEAVVIVLDFIKNVIRFLHIKEILLINDIVKVLWPQYRAWQNKILGRVAEFSQKIGMGVDGVGTFLQSCRQGANILAGVLGKDEQWLQMKWMDTTLEAIDRFLYDFELTTEIPWLVMKWAYEETNTTTYKEISTWWTKTAAFVDGMAKVTLSLVTKVNDTIGDLQKLTNNLPAFIRDNIPQSILEGIAWTDNMIDDNILPALTKIDKTFTEVNAVLEAHRKRAEALVEQLTRPGDLLLSLDQLTEAGKLDQEDKIDDVASRKYERDTDMYEAEDAGIIAEFARIEEAMKVPTPPPVFLAIEDMPAHLIPEIVLEERETWFVGDF